MDDDFSFDLFDLDPDELVEDGFTVPEPGTDHLLGDSSLPDLPGGELESAGNHDLHPSWEPHFGGGGKVGRERSAGLLLVADGDVEEARDALLEKGIEVKIPITTSEGDVEIKSS